ncbi:hypothetical protein [Robiginitomaculum antarcticum]|uniref:hypothetical protein n=1 Tax=Robiginitomaculum antarcticum TaxID=437507 RepID=UPI0003616FA5|nr:hypothetical protein [Robiginitomaculum antarcticum]
MRLLSIAAIGVSTLALSGCSFFNGMWGQSGHHGANNYNGGAYAASNCGNSCVGGKQISRLNFEAGAGYDFITGGEAITGSNVAPFPGQNINDIDMKDAYEDAFNVFAGGSYMLNPDRKLTGQYTYSTAKGQTNDLGRETGRLTNTNAKLSRYESHGLDLGVRQYFRPKYLGSTNFRYRPYVEGKIGATYVDDIKLITVEQGNPASSRTVDFYDSGWVPTAAGMVGIETPLFNRTTIGLETGIRYTGKMDDAQNLQAQAPNLAGANDGGERWTVPVAIRGRYRF